MALGKKMAYLPLPFLPKINLDPLIQKVSKKFEIFPAPSYEIQKEILAAHKKYLGVGGSIYHGK